MDPTNLLLNIVKYLDKNRAQGTSEHAYKHLIFGGLLIIGGIYLYKKIEANIDIQKNKKEAEEKRKTIKIKESEKQNTIKVKTEEQKDLLRFKEEIRSKKQDEKITPTKDMQEIKIESYHETLRKGMLENSKERMLGFPWLREGYDTGLVAPTNCGKTTFVMQVAIALARGYSEISIADEWHSIKPMRVVVFALEQNYKEIAQYYGSAINDLRRLEIHCEAGLRTEHILSILRNVIKETDEDGIVVIFDNHTKLEERCGAKAVKAFNQELEVLQAECSKTGKSLTTLKVFHTNDKWKPGTPFSPSYVRGNKNSVNMTKNFIYLSPCKLGTNFRVLGYLKMKHGEQECYILLRYADTEINQFCYIGKGSANDLGLPQNNGHTYVTNKTTANHSTDFTDKKIKEETDIAKKNKVGRPTDFTDEQMLEWYHRVQKGECTYKQIEEEHNVKKCAIKKRVQRINNRKKEKNERDKVPICPIHIFSNNLIANGL